MGTIRVWAVKRGDRPYYVLRWRDPRTGRRREEATTATRRRDAEQAAGAKAEALAKESHSDSIAWDEVQTRYEREVLAMQAVKSLGSFRSAVRKFNQLSQVWALDEITAAVVSRYTSLLYDEGLAVESIRCYLRELRRCLRWASEIWEDFKAPRIRLPRAPKRDAMKGRPITAEEFERMLEAVPAALSGPLRPPPEKRAKQKASKPDRPKAGPKPEVVESWRFFLRGLWHSGLRLGEALAFSWDDETTLHVWDIEERRPMIRVLAHSEKGRRDRIIPMTPQLVWLLRSVPKRRRRGPVFKPLGKRGQPVKLESVSAWVAKFGECARVVVETSPGRDGRPVTAYASAHDLRRSFATRLAPLIHPLQLMDLMRHESFATTNKYYVGLNAIRTANDLWAALGESCDQPCDKPADAENGDCRKV